MGEDTPDNTTADAGERQRRRARPTPSLLAEDPPRVAHDCHGHGNAIVLGVQEQRHQQFNSIVQGHVDALNSPAHDVVLVSNRDAKRLGLSDGDALVLRSRRVVCAGETLPTGSIQVHWARAPRAPIGRAALHRERDPGACTVTGAWVEWTLAAECPDGWAHHGLAMLGQQTIVAFHPRDRDLLLFGDDGTLVRRVPCEAMEAHDIEVAPDGIWLADCGHKLCVPAAGEPFVSPPIEQAVGRVWLVDPADGRTLRTIDAPDDRQFLPTGVALDPLGRGLWVADGYGSDRVFLFDADGAVLRVIEGFDTAHGIAVDRRRSDEPLLVIAERGARRLAIHDLDGAFVRHDGVDILLAPCATAIVGDELHVADLAGRVTVLALDGSLVAHLAPHGEHSEGWPNAVELGCTVPPPLVVERFNSPHGICGAGDDVVVTEWLLGGRWVRYSPTTMKERAGWS